MNLPTRLCLSALLSGIFVCLPLSSRAGTLSVTNGSFTNLSSNSATGGGWYGGVPAGWTSTSPSASNGYQILESGGTYFANLNTLSSISGGFFPLRQSVGTVDITSDVTLTFTMTTLGGTPTLGSAIYNSANDAALQTYDPGAITGLSTVSYTARGVGPATSIYIGFWSGSSPGITGVSILDSATTYLWNGGVSGVWTNGGGGWTDKFDTNATTYNNAKPVVAQFTNSAAGTNVTVASDGVTVGNVQVSGANYTLSGGTITMTNTTWSVAGSNTTASVGSTLAGTTGLIKNDTGTLALGASNSYTGATAVNAGTLTIADGNALGGTAQGTTVASGAQLRFTATNSGFTVDEALTISGDGVGAGGALRNTAGSNTYQGKITLAANATIGVGNSVLTIDTASGNAIEANNFTLTFVGNGTNRVNDAISLGSGGIIKSGAGLAVLAVSNSYSGGTTISNGTLRVENANALGSGALTVNGGTLDLGGNNLTAVNLSGTNGTISLGANTLTASMSSGAEFSGVISGSGSVVKTGSSFLTLKGNNTYSGGTLINGGTIYVTGSGTLGNAAGAVTVSNAVLDLRNAQTRTGTITMIGQDARLLSGDINNPGSVVNNGGALQFGGGLISASISGTGGLNVTGGGSLNSSNSYTGATTISDTTGWYGANTLFVVDANALGAASGDLTISGGTVSLQNNTVTRSGNVTISGGTLQTGTLSKSGTAYDIQGGQISAVLAGSSGLTKSGSGTATLAASNSYAGATDLQAGTLSLSGNGRLGAGAVTISNGATLDFATGVGQTDVVGNDISGAGQLLNNNNSETRFTGSVTSTGGLTINSGTVRIGNGGTTGSYTGDTALNGGTLAFDRSDTFSYGGNISGSGSLAKVSAGTVVLSGNSTNFSGTMTIFAGTARIGDGATNGLFSGNTTVNSGGTLAFDRSDASSYGGSITGAGSLVKVNAGALTLTASNSYSGVTTLFAGTLVADNANALGTGNITFNPAGGNTGTIRYTAASAGTDWASRLKNSSGTIRLDTDGNNVTLAGAIDSSNTQGLTKSGSGTLTLSGNNGFSGGTVLSEGTLRLDHTNAAGIGTITQTTNNSTLQINTAGTLANAMSIFNVHTLQTVTLSGNKTLNNATYTVDPGTTTTESGVLGGGGGITKEGTGTLIVTASNSFTGNTIVNAGVLNLNSATGAALGASTNVTVSATLLISQSGQINDTAAVTLSGGTIQRGSGVSEVFGSLNLTGASFLDFGTGATGSMSFGIYEEDAAPSALLTIDNFLPGNSFTFSNNLFQSNGSNIGSYFSFSTGTGYLGNSITDNGGGSFTITSIPEPSTYVAAAGLIGWMLWSFRRPGRRRTLLSKGSLAGKC